MGNDVSAEHLIDGPWLFRISAQGLFCFCVSDIDDTFEAAMDMLQSVVVIFGLCSCWRSKRSDRFCSFVITMLRTARSGASLPMPQGTQSVLEIAETFLMVSSAVSRVAS